MIDERTPITSASPITLRITWPRVAPSARIIPNSRVRWATVIQNVLKMMKAPTNRARTPNVVSTGDRKLLISLEISSAWASAFSWPVSTFAISGRVFCRFALSWLARDAVLGGGHHPRNLALALEPLLRVAERGQHEGRAADRLGVAELEDADDLHRHGADARRELDARLVDGDVLPVGGVLDQRHLARVLRQAALDRRCSG